MILCDVCWIVMGKSDEYEHLLDDKRLHWIGSWNMCTNCLKRYEELVWIDVKSKEYRKN